MLTEIQTLKLRLFADGLFITEAARRELSLGNSRPLTLADYVTTSGIFLRLDGNTWINAPINDSSPDIVKAGSPVLEYSNDAGTYAVRSGDLVFEVHPLAMPSYHFERNESDEAYVDYVVTHADRVRLSPIEGCGIVCTFCDAPYRSRYRKRRIEGLIDATRVALKDPVLPARHILISGGTPRAEDYDYENIVYQEVAREFSDVPIDIMMSPSPGLLDLDFLHEIGIHGLAINIELFNPAFAKKITPLKAELGIDHYFDFIESAVAVFGVGQVRSLVVVGLESAEDTLRGVGELAARGCEPVLSPFRPDPATPLRNHPVPSFDFLRRVYLESREIVGKYPSVRLGPSCIACQHNTLTFPDGSDYYGFH